MTSLKIPPSSVSVRTLDGFSLQYAYHYPILADFDGHQPEDNDSWSMLRKGAISMFGSAHIKKVLEASYSGAFVDEYQDCSQLQHQIVQQIANALPTRILGDPLQGVFEFDDVVDWQQNVESYFPNLRLAETPWRWNRSNPALGEELQDVRKKLLAGESIDFRAYKEIKYHEFSTQMQIDACHQAANLFPSVVAIHKWPSQCHNLAQKLSGRFSSMEPLESQDLKTICQNLDISTGSARAILLINFAKECLACLPTGISDARDLFEKGKLPRITPTRKNAEAYRCLVDVARHDDWINILEAIKVLEAIPRVFVYRRECWSALKHVLRVALTESKPIRLSEIARLIRERTRHAGRAAEKLTVSRVLLVKGLEYNQSIVLDPEQQSTSQELYVALTRGSHAVTLLSKEPIYRPFKHLRNETLFPS